MLLWFAGLFVIAILLPSSFPPSRLSRSQRSGRSPSSSSSFFSSTGAISHCLKPSGTARPPAKESPRSASSSKPAGPSGSSSHGPQLHPLHRPDSVLLRRRRRHHVCHQAAPATGRPRRRHPRRARSQPGVPALDDAGSRTFTAASFPPASHSRAPPLVSLPSRHRRASPSDLEVLEGFFSRRLDMPLDIRQGLAERIAAAIEAKSGVEPPPGVSTETFLEAVARDLRDVARMR